MHTPYATLIINRKIKANMALYREILKDLHEAHIKGTIKKAIVTDKTVIVCHLTFAVMKALNCDKGKVYINTRVLKHIYDKRPAEEYDTILIVGTKSLKNRTEFISTKALNLEIMFLLAK